MNVEFCPLNNITQSFAYFRIIFKLIIIVKSNKIINKTFNIGSGISTDINKITCEIEKKFKNEVKFKYLPISKKELNYTKACIDNMIKYLKYNQNLI